MAKAATARADERERPVLRLLGAQAAADLAGQVVTGRELRRRREEQRATAFPTGLAALDGLLAAGGAAAGLPRGCLVELVGRASSGRLAAALSTLAAATAAGEAAAFVDLGDHLDPESLAAAGADPDRLLWVRPRDLGEALAAAEAILAGGLPLVVVDLGLPPVPGGRGAEASWLRLARAAQSHGAALLVSTPYRVSGTAAHAVVSAETRRGLYADGGPRLLQGLSLHFTLDKLRGHRPGATAATELLHPQTHAEDLLPSNLTTSASVVRPFPSPASGENPNPSARRAVTGRPTSGAGTTVSESPTPGSGAAVVGRPTSGAAATTSGERLTSGAVGAQAATSPVPGAAGAAAGKLGAGAGPARWEGASGGVPAPCRRELPTQKSEKARAGSRPQPPPRPLATAGDLTTTPPPPRASATDGDFSTTPPPPRPRPTAGDRSTTPPPPRPLVIEIPPLHAP